ncbi:MAG: exo-alpha-sialidase [Acidobacteriota bacterium]|nr:exo-alpha-sialidase [Acidobacteriota bacterium]
MKSVMLLCLAATVLRADAKTEFIFSTAPFASCHASTVVELRNGDVMSAWFGGSGEGNPDVAIWAARRSGDMWSAPIEVVREPNIAAYNPVLFYTKDQRLWLYYKFGAHPMSWSAGRRWSGDDGKTWSQVEHLPAGLYGPVRAKPLVMADGTIVSGTSVESFRSWAAWIERSTDNGLTWTKFGPITVEPKTAAPAGGGDAPPDVPGSNDWKYTEGIIQPSVVSLGGKKLRLYARSTSRTGKICVADSSDAGVTWTQARPIDVPNPNSGIDAVALQDGRVVLIYNNTPRGRSPLNLAVSKDGEHFRMFHTLEDTPGEYSYPAMVQAKNGDLLITYTWQRKRIRFVRYPLSDIPNP